MVYATDNWLFYPFSKIMLRRYFFMKQNDYSVELQSPRQIQFPLNS